MLADSQTSGLTAVERRSTTDDVLAELRAAIESGRARMEPAAAGEKATPPDGDGK